MMWKWLLVLSLFSFSAEAIAAERIVLLAPAAGDILQRLDASELVVGVTRSLKEFPQARRVGSHIRPNLELIRSLDPDLIIISSNRFFTREMEATLGVPVQSYHPRTLEEILQQISKLAGLLGRTPQGAGLVRELRARLAEVKPVAKPPQVIYEISAMPLTVAGQKNIVADLIHRAGGIPLPEQARKMVRFNPEAVLALQPDIYIYQVGPMNKNPLPPVERGPYSRLKARYQRVDELQFARANSGSFSNLLLLNRLFRGEQLTMEPQ